MQPELVSLTLGQVLCEPWTVAPHVYFPNDSLISLIAVAAGGKGLEVGMVGRQGMFGASLVLGAGKSPIRALVQAAGTAMRSSAGRFSTELKRNGPLRLAALRHTNISAATTIQIAACNNAHSIDQRCARWLLMTSDCLAMSSFFLTQAFLAEMLGVRRTGVNEAATRLQKRGFIVYSRGRIEILNRSELMAASCGCYAIIRNLEKG